MSQVTMGGGAFRSARLIPLCATCRDPAASACPRCGAPSCRAHDPGIARRCPDCEETYTLLRRDRQEQPLSWSMLLLAYASGPAIVALAGMPLRSFPWLLLVVALAASGMPLYIIAYRRAVLRTRFLAERPTRRRLAPSRATMRALLRPSDHSRPREDELAVAALILCLLCVPPLPQVGLGLAIFVCSTWQRRSSLRYVALAIPAALLGVAWTAVLGALLLAPFAPPVPVTALLAALVTVCLAGTSLILLLTIGRQRLRELGRWVARLHARRRSGAAVG